MELEFKDKKYPVVSDIKCKATKKLKKFRKEAKEAVGNIDGDIFMEQLVILLAESVCPTLHKKLNFTEEETLFDKEELGHGDLCILLAKLQDSYNQIMKVNLPHIYSDLPVETKEETENKEDKQKKNDDIEAIKT